MSSTFPFPNRVRICLGVFEDAEDAEDAAWEDERFQAAEGGVGGGFAVAADIEDLGPA